MAISKKLIILRKLSEIGSTTYPELVRAVGNATGQTQAIMTSYISQLKSAGFIEGGGNGGRISLSEEGENYVDTQGTIDPEEGRDAGYPDVSDGIPQEPNEPNNPMEDDPPPNKPGEPPEDATIPADFEEKLLGSLRTKIVVGPLSESEKESLGDAMAEHNAKCPGEDDYPTSSIKVATTLDEMINTSLENQTLRLARQFVSVMLDADEGIAAETLLKLLTIPGTDDDPAETLPEVLAMDEVSRILDALNVKELYRVKVWLAARYPLRYTQVGGQFVVAGDIE